LTLSLGVRAIIFFLANCWGLIAGFGQLLFWAFCFLLRPMIKIVLQSLTIF
jgi:hypothetical protein